MSEQQGEAVWVFPDEPKRRGRGALIAVLVLAVLLVAALLVFFLIPRGGATPGPTPTASPTKTTTPSPTPTSTPTAAPRPTPTPALPTAPVTVQPTPVDPSVPAFRDQVGPRLNDAETGLRIIASDASQGDGVVDQLQQDAQRLSEVIAPSSISTAWWDRVSAYSARLNELRAAADGGGDLTPSIAAARTALGDLRSLLG